MKKILNLSSLCFVGLFFWSNVHAVTMELKDPCHPDEIIKEDLHPGQLPVTAGALTLDFFKKVGVPFQGNEAGIQSVFGSPTGDDALVVINDEQMKAYGWCYRVNGKLPDVYMDQFKINRDDDHIEWFFGYSFYDRGEWKDYCTPATKDGPVYYCR